MIFLVCDACAVYLALCLSQLDIIGVCLLALNDAVVDKSRSLIVDASHEYDVMYEGYRCGIARF